MRCCAGEAYGGNNVRMNEKVFLSRGLNNCPVDIRSVSKPIYTGNNMDESRTESRPRGLRRARGNPRNALSKGCGEPIASGAMAPDAWGSGKIRHAQALPCMANRCRESSTSVLTTWCFIGTGYRLMPAFGSGLDLRRCAREEQSRLVDDAPEQLYQNRTAAVSRFLGHLQRAGIAQRRGGSEIAAG